MINKNIKNNIYNVLIVIILVVYILSGMYPKHNDFWIMNYVAKSFAIGNYDFYSDILSTQKLPNSFVAYPPIWYIVQGLYIKILSVIFSYDLHNWQQVMVQTTFMPLFGILPNIIIFFVGGLFISKTYPGKKELLIYYLASPLAFISIEVMGQIDVYPAFFTLIALYFAKKSFDTNKQLWKIMSVLSLGIGGQFKLYPLLLLLPVAIFLSDKKFVHMLEYTFLGMIVSFIPWIGYVKWFKFIVIDGESSFLFNLQLVSINTPYHNISIWLVGYCVMLWAIFKYVNSNFRNLVGLIFIEISWFFITVYTHPQWWIWLAPISIFVLAEFRNRIFIFFYIILNSLYVLYPMMWINNVDIILREYVPIIPIIGAMSIILVSAIISLLLIWSLELFSEINKDTLSIKK